MTHATIAELATVAGRTHGDRIAMRFRRDGEWHEHTYAELADGLRRLGVGPGDRVALLAETRPEWTVCGLAVAGTGAVCVPIYPTSSADECA